MATAHARFDRREVAGPFDIVGDVHGCCDELEELLAALSYEVTWSAGPHGRQVDVTPPPGRRLVFVGDLADRGPRTPDVLRIAMSMERAGTGFTVEGNHDNKLARWLAGRPAKATNGLQASIDQMQAETPACRVEARSFLEHLPSYLWLDGGALVVAHAGIKEDMIGHDNDRIRSFTLYGDTSGEVDAYGYPVRRDWAAHYEGKPAIVYGHVAAPDVVWFNNTICIDSGCVFGGRLTALRWPERELVSVPARRQWYEPKQPLEGRKRR
jgi:protein phosphatase